MRFLYTLFLACFLLQGCKKDDIRQFTFTNKMPDAVVVNIYGSEEDYYNNKNVLYSGLADANNILEIPYTIFKNEYQVYYIDWFSKDFQYSNWYNYINGAMFNPGDSTGYVTGAPDLLFIGVARQLLLSGNETSSKWKTTGSYDNNQTWNSLSELDRNYELEFHKNMKVTIKSKNQIQTYEYKYYGNGNNLAVTINSSYPMYLNFSYLIYPIPVSTSKIFFYNFRDIPGLYIEKQL